jgi:hypothetical protein
MKAINKKRNVKAKVKLPVKGDNKKEFVLKHPPSLKPKSKRAK